MTLFWLLPLLLSLTLSSITVNLGQPMLEEKENDDRGLLEKFLQRAENIILRSKLKEIEEEGKTNSEPQFLQQDWLDKRQHPGKRYMDDLVKRQHPGKREGEEEEEEEEGEAGNGELFMEAQKRQHPGKRSESGEEQLLEAQKRQHPGRRDEYDSEAFREQQKRQHPGRRSPWDRYTEGPSPQFMSLVEFSKSQLPGMGHQVYSKRQHPGKRSWEGELAFNSQADVEKRQHPGKRWIPDSGSPDPSSPCGPQDGPNCSRASLLLEFLDDIGKGERDEEKRQHPGRSLPGEEEMAAEE
ncbi:thyrotropin releasing hormone [Tachyglossus aculeatus]|uniref:thyrotropin releasing hormone n=1 Tax=Tachyglossus aculeatus TaxID=9261 RepID=UPI0018F636BD|nr:thyrotropin releasing hormone [Tachyglossus aculeatus]